MKLHQRLVLWLTLLWISLIAVIQKRKVVVTLTDRNTSAGIIMGSFQIDVYLPGKVKHSTAAVRVIGLDGVEEYQFTTAANIARESIDIHKMYGKIPVILQATQLRVGIIIKR